MGRGVPSPSRLGGLGSVVSSHSEVRGEAPAGNAFWRILNATECSFFTARRSYASAVLGVVILSVRPSVCTSVTRVLSD